MKKKVYGSLARRIFSLCFFLIALPLILHSLFVWDRDDQIRVRTTLSQLNLIGEADERLLAEWANYREAELEIYSDLLKNSTTLPKRADRYSTLFVFDRALKCIASSVPAMIGIDTFFSKELTDAFGNDRLLFIGISPETKQKELFVLRKVGAHVWGLSVEMRRGLPNFLTQETPFSMDLITKFESVSEGNDIIFSQDTLLREEKELGFFAARKLKGKNLSLQIPIQDADFVLEVTIPASVWEKFEGGELFAHILFLLFLVIIVGGGSSYFIMRRMARPMHQFIDVMDAVANKDYEKRFRADPMGFEINTLGENFNEMIGRLLKNLEVEKELKIGREIQAALLPKELPEFPGIEVGTGFLPAKEVAGDFYDLFPIDKDRFMIVMADGSDKGVSACLYSLMVRSLLRSYIGAEGTLEGTIRAVNELFCKDTGDSGNFVTAWVGIYSVTERKLQYTSAGHFPAVLVLPDGEMEELTTGGIALGVISIEDVEVKTKVLAPNSTLLLYTDGVVEAHNEKGDLFGKDHLIEWMKASRALPTDQLIPKLINEIEGFASGAMQHDDLTLLCIKML